MKTPFGMDERNVEITRRICARLYLITLMLLMGSMWYRQFILRQETGEFEDIALIFTFNTLFLLGALFYYGGITLPRIKPLPLLGIYVGFALLGSLFTLFKYTLLQGRTFDMGVLSHSLSITATICALIVMAYAFLAYLGGRKVDREIDREEEILRSNP